MENKLLKVQQGDKQNILKPDNQLLSDIWFTDIDEFDNGTARVEMYDPDQKTHVYNLLDITTHKFLLKDWVKSIEHFQDGLARIKTDQGINFINEKGEIMCNDWFTYASEFSNGFSIVSKTDNYDSTSKNVINTKGEFLSEDWFDDVVDIFSNKLCKNMENTPMFCIIISERKNVMNETGEILSRIWFDYIHYFKNGFAKVEWYEKYNVIDTNGNLILKDWYDYVSDFDKGVAIVNKNSQYNIVDTTGNLLSPKWFTIKSLVEF